MRIDDIEPVMKDLGFSPNESRAYTALVETHPLTGYELSRRSAVPRSKVYECIERLERKGLVVAIGGNPVRYMPVPPDELVRRLKAEFSSSLCRFRDLLAEGPAVDEAEYVFNIGGYEGIMEKAADMLRSARVSLDLAVWGEEIDLLGAELEQAAGRGIRTRLLVFDRGNVPGCEVYRHRTLAPGEFTGRWLAVVRDGTEVLTGRCSGGGDIIAAWTKNRSLVFVSLKYIEHEIIRIQERGRS